MHRMALHHGLAAGRLCGLPAADGAQEFPMMDIVMSALALGFFAAGIGYAYACERL
jgi:hypothetical protein